MISVINNRMKKLQVLITLFLLLVFGIVSGQYKVISGKAIDEYSKKPVTDVSISSSVNTDNIFTGKKGKFAIILPNHYYDTLVFSHPEYFPQVFNVKKTSRYVFNNVTMINKDVDIDTMCYTAYAENRVLHGEIIEMQNRRPIVGAAIYLGDKKIAYSNTDGEFSVGIPVLTRNIILVHPEFRSQTVDVINGKKQLRKIEVKLAREVFGMEDTLWLSRKNIVAVSINELITGSIGVRYQRFINTNHGVGLYTSSYIYGYFPQFNSPGSKFKGFKLAPYYRYYLDRSRYNSFFIEGKVSSGYFNFEELYYAYPPDNRDGEHVKETFWTVGFGAGIGFTTSIPHRNNDIMTISIGYQYLPMHVPQTIESQSYGTLEIQNNWWYFAGPGSVFEIKFAFGGLF